MSQVELGLGFDNFHIPKVFLITFSEGNGRTEIEKNISNNALVCDDEAHIVVLCTHSPFFCTRWVSLRSKKTTFKIHPMIKGKINSSIRKLLTKKCEKHKMNGQALPKMGNIIF